MKTIIIVTCKGKRVVTTAPRMEIKATCRDGWWTAKTEIFEERKK